MQKRIISGLVVVVLMAGLGFGAYYLAGPCGVIPVNAARDSISDALNRFDSASRLAGSTPRIGLAAPIKSMQDIVLETQLISVPECMREAKNQIVEGMKVTVDAMLGFMSQNVSDEVVGARMDVAAQYFENSAGILIKVQACVPFCSGVVQP